MIGTTPIACVVTNPRLHDNPIIAVNPPFVALVGYALDQIVGRNCRLLSGPESDLTARSRLRDAIEGRRSAVVEVINYRQNGSSFRNVVMIAPLFDDTGDLLYFIGAQMPIDGDRLDARRMAAETALGDLSVRQADVLKHMATGIRYAQIGIALNITEKTVKMHRAALIKKLGCVTSARAIRIAIEAGF